MKLIIDISKDRYDEILAMDWKNGRRFFDEEIRAIHDGKALEQQPCEDAVSRQDVLDAIDTYDKFGYTETGCFVREPKGDYVPYIHFDDVIKCIKNAPPVTPQPRWIPVSERLPEVGSEVLVCFDFKGKRSVYISHFYGDGEFHGLDDEYLTTEGRKYRKAVAWMPLPTPPNKSEIPTGSEGSE